MASNTIYLNDSAKTSDGDWLEGKIDWSSTANNDANTSSVTAKIYVRKASNIQLTQTTTGNWGYSLTVDGSTVSGTSSQITVLTSWVQIASKTVTVNHNTDGSKSITISGYVSGPSTSKYSGLKTSGTGTATLDTIPGAATIDKITNSSGTTISSINTGNTIRVYWTPRSATHKYEVFIDGVMYPPAGQGYYTVSSTSQTYREFTIAHSDLPTSTSKKINIQLKTYNNSTVQVGNLSTKTLTISVPSSVQPSISSFTATIVDGFTSGSDTYYVQGKSKCTLVMKFTPGSGSSIKSYSMSGQDLSGASGTSSSATSLSRTTSILTKPGTFYYNASVTDKRDRSYVINASNNSSKRASIYVYPYAAPSIKISVARTVTSGSVKLTYNATYSSINGANKLESLKIYRKLSTSSTWPSTPVATITLGATTNGSESGNTTITECDPTSSYDFKATVVDTAYSSSSTSNIVSVSTEFRLINIKSDGTGIAFGKLSEESNIFDSNLPIKAKEMTLNGFRVPEIQHGEIEITPSAANTPTEKEVTFEKSFSGVPHIIITPYTSAPGTTVLSASVSGTPTETGFTACLTRSNTTVTTLVWVAIY